jgi:hypothetical protein
MNKGLEKRPITLKTGDEHLSGTVNTLLDFWRWNSSDLVNNTTRGLLAEFIVASALGIDLSVPREGWSVWDLTSPEGIRIEVKSAAYLQSWTQRKLSRINFSIRPVHEWNVEYSSFTKSMLERFADVYVFCLLKHKDKETLNPLDLTQWEFYVISTDELNSKSRISKSISLSSIQKLTKAIPFAQLHEAVIEAKSFEHTLSRLFDCIEKTHD